MLVPRAERCRYRDEAGRIGLVKIELVFPCLRVCESGRLVVGLLLAMDGRRECLSRNFGNKTKVRKSSAPSVVGV